MRFSFFKLTFLTFLLLNSYSFGQKVSADVQKGKAYGTYFAKIDAPTVDFKDVKGECQVKWYNPRAREQLLGGSVKNVTVDAIVDLGKPPKDETKD